MLPEKLETALAQVELQSQEVATALGGDDPVALEKAAGTLRQAVLVFSQLVPHMSSADRASGPLKLRLKRLASALTTHRESLIRRSVMVERSLGTLMPTATQSATYGKPSSPYGSRGRQTEAFKVLAA